MKERCSYCGDKLYENEGTKGWYCYGCRVAWMRWKMMIQKCDGWWVDVPEGCLLVKKEIGV